MIECCILKGRTTTEDQFKRFLDSYFEALKNRENWTDVVYHPYSDVVSTFMVDSDEAESSVKTHIEALGLDVSSELSEGRLFVILRRSDDPGELRNEFLANLGMYYTEEEAKKYHLAFMFFDGDDEISDNYFNFDESLVMGKGFAMMNPVAVYGDEATDQYPLKWCQSSLGADMFECALTDKIGGQCWGKVWEWQVCKESKFGRGLFEDVRFWYDITKKYRNPLLLWNHIYYWYRNNPSALTRSIANEAQIRDGLDNLEYAKNIARSVYPYSDKRVWKRYTTGVQVLLRNAQKSSDPNEMAKYIANNIDSNAFKPELLRQEEPKFFAKLMDDFPNYLDWEKNFVEQINEN